MIAAAVNGLDRLDQFVPALESRARWHVGYGVRDEDYQTVGAALLLMLEPGLGAEFTADVKEAWGSCYALLPGITQKAATQPAG